MFLGLLRAELAKLRDPMTLLTLVGGPAAVALLLFLGVTIRRAPGDWGEYIARMMGFWTFFIFPLALTAFAAFYAQVEHRARAWDHLLALPIPKWRVFAVKALVLAAATIAMHALYIVLAPAAAALGGMIARQGPLTGTLTLAPFVKQLVTVEGASLLMIAVQLWVSLRFSQFAAPIMIGIGAFTATLAASFFGYLDYTRFFPWGVAYAMTIVADASLRTLLLWYGLAGGLLAFAAMVAHLSRREMR